MWGCSLFILVEELFFSVALNSVQSVQKDLFHFVGLVIAVGNEGSAALLSFHPQTLYTRDSVTEACSECTSKPLCM